MTDTDTFAVRAALVVALVIGLAVGLAPVGPASGAAGEATTGWSMFHADPANTGHLQTTGPVDNVTERWNYTTSGFVVASPAVVDGTVYVGSYGTGMYALNATSGAERWNVTTPRWVSSSAAVVDGTVYVGGLDNRIYALNATDGTERWNASTDSDVVASPAVINGTVYVASDDGTVYALNATDGTQRWNVTTGGGGESVVESSPAVVDGTVYVGSDDGTVYALDADTGTERWTFATDAAVDSSPAVVGGTVYVGSNDSIVYALNATTGTMQWTTATGGAVVSSPAVVDGTVYVGSDDGNVYALDADTGTERWNASTGGPVVSSPAVVNGTVYVGSDDGNVYAFDADTGTERWNASTGGTVTSSPAVLDGTVYVGSDDTRVYALTGDTITTESNPANFTVGIDSTNSPITEGETLTVAGIVENTGNETDTQSITLYVGDVERDSTTVTLAPGESTAVTLTWETVAGDAGEYSAIVTSANDSASRTVTVEPSGAEVPSGDLAPPYFAVSIEGTNAPVNESERLDVTATITNTGDTPDTQSVSLSINGTEDSGAPRLLQPDSTSLTLDAGESRTITLSWATSFGDAGEYTAAVASDNESDSIAVTISHQPQASVTFNDQSVSSEVDTQAVTIASVTMSEGGFVTIRDPGSGTGAGAVIGASSYRSAGTHENVRIALDENIQTAQTLLAVPHNDTDGDNRYEFAGGSLDAPYTAGGATVSDSAMVQVVVDTPIPEGTQSQTRSPSPSPSPTSSPSPDPSPSPTGTPDLASPPTSPSSPTPGTATAEEAPGFGVGAALLAVLLAVVLARRRNRG